MASNEEIERMRQAIMRFRELLDIAQLRVQDGERAYDHLFAGFTPEQLAATKEKDLQWLLAEDLLDDPKMLGNAVMQAQYDMQDMERAFEELYHIIISIGA